LPLWQVSGNRHFVLWVGAFVAPSFHDGAVRSLKLITVLLATAGTLAFVFASRATPRPLTAIAAVQPSMNYAYVRIEGIVPAFASLQGNDYLSFRVMDAGGDLRVSAYRNVVEQLLAQNKVPRPGDRVTVEGTLRIRDDEPSLILNTVEGLMIETPDAPAITLSALDAMPMGDKATVTAQVRRIREISPRLRVVTLREGSATADMLLPVGDAVFGEAPEVREGEWIEAAGGVGEYRDAKQLLPASASAIAKISAPPADLRPLAALNDDLLGQWVRVQATIDDLRPFAQGMRVMLSEDDTTLVAVLFDRVWQGLAFSETLQAGDVIQLQGELSDYRGELELIPELPVDVEQVSK
jgi:DNA/RNA endonuclease YhcR with UshA esterase domain